MKKIPCLFFLLFSIVSLPNPSIGQNMQSINYGPGGWYRNYEKYWWYRYRLVNDFMKLGEACGESIPARIRTRDNLPNAQIRSGWLEWGDAPQDLGHYLVTTATEHQILGTNNFNTNRSAYENYSAQNALERLDLNAEAYCEDIHGTKYCNPNYQEYNGFFIRDDVPLNFVQLNIKHFNRPGIINRTPIFTTPITTTMNGGGSYIHLGAYSDYTRIAAISAAHWYSAYAVDKVAMAPPISQTGAPPQYPVEQSQDALSEVFTGLAVSSKYLGFAGVNGQNLQQKANDNLYRLISYPATGPGPWIIKNPLTNECVYGTESPSHFVNHLTGCFTSGANMTNSSPAVVEALSLTVGSGYSTAGMYVTAGQHMTLFQLSQFWTSEQNMYTENYVALSRTWLAGVTFPFNAINTSWTRLRNHAMSNSFRTPHLPLIYKLHYPNNGVDYCPECHKQKNTAYVIPSYENLLDRSTFCGNYNYSTHEGPGAYGDWEWSNIDRLSHPSERGHDNKADFNGLDYMELFNLYSLVKEDYLKWVFNPYYDQFYSIGYPSTGGLGSHDLPLKLNYLEYLSMVNTIEPTGNVIVRGAKVIELLPGFEAKKDCLFEAYVKDYDCDAEGYCYAMRKVNPEAEYECFQYNPTGQQYNPGDDGGGDPRRRYWIQEDSLADALLTISDELKYKEYLLGKLEGTDYEAANTQMPELLPSIRKRTISGKFESDTHIEVKVRPNPNNGAFSVHINTTENYTIDVINVLGQIVYSASDNSIEHLVRIPNAQSGNYIVRVTQGQNTYYSKFAVIK